MTQAGAPYSELSYRGP